MGGGFAGVAAAWHLLALTHPRAVDLDLFDAAGIAGGASGAAAGLLHPFSPKGKVRLAASVLSVSTMTLPVTFLFCQLEGCFLGLWRQAAVYFVLMVITRSTICLCFYGHHCQQWALGHMRGSAAVIWSQQQ